MPPGRVTRCVRGWLENRFQNFEILVPERYRGNPQSVPNLGRLFSFFLVSLFIFSSFRRPSGNPNRRGRRRQPSHFATVIYTNPVGCLAVCRCPFLCAACCPLPALRASPHVRCLLLGPSTAWSLDARSLFALPPRRWSLRTCATDARPSATVTCRSAMSPHRSLRMHLG